MLTVDVKNDKGKMLPIYIARVTGCNQMFPMAGYVAGTQVAKFDVMGVSSNIHAIKIHDKLLLVNARR